MDNFTIEGHGNFVRIRFKRIFGFPDETCHWGGYDTESEIEIKVEDFNVNSTLYLTTGEVFEFYKNLAICNERLKGDVALENYEGDLDLKLRYDITGEVDITGSFSQNHGLIRLEFEFKTDQSYIQSTLSQLKAIVLKYGDSKGVKKK
ncbi:MAG: hypothetical protein ABJA76_12940 [Mucilaginibacter sp.]